MARGYTDYLLIEEFKEDLKAGPFFGFLTQCASTAEIIRQEERPVWRERSGSEALREETRLRDLQNLEYEMAKQQDKQKEEEKQKEVRTRREDDQKEQDVEQLKQQKKEEKQMYILYKKSEVVEEPSATTAGITTIKFREPHSGKSFARWFLRTHTV